MTLTEAPVPPAGARDGRTPHGPGHATETLLRRRACLPPAHPDRHRLRHQAVEASLPLARYLARRYADRGEPLDDLQQVASVGLVKAVDGFDPWLGKDFCAYAIPTITGEIKRYFRDRTWAVQVPRRYKDLQQEIHRCRGELAQRLRRLPRVADFAEHLDADRGEITQALIAESGYSSISLSAPPPAESRAGVLDRTGTPEPGYDMIDLHESIYPALARLPARERRIITMRYFGNMTQSEIAAEVGLSQMHVSRLIPRILGRLRGSLQDAY